MISKYARNRNLLYDLIADHTELWETEVEALTNYIWNSPMYCKNNPQHFQEMTRLSETKARELHGMIFPTSDQTQPDVTWEQLYDENIRLKNELCSLDEVNRNLKLELDKVSNWYAFYKGLTAELLSLFNPL